MARWARWSMVGSALSKPIAACCLALLAFDIALWALGVEPCWLAAAASTAVSTPPVRFAWDPIDGTSLAGYRLYYGAASGEYSHSVNVGKATAVSLAGLEPRQIYYIAITAYDRSGHESEFSNEVIYDLSQVDADKDGLSDWDEISVYRTDPMQADTDGDGLNDGEEAILYGTDPLSADTDGDGVSDGEEVRRGADPQGSASEFLPNVPEIPWEQMWVISVDSEELQRLDGRAEHAIDGDTSTIWHTEVAATSPEPPHEMVLALGNEYRVSGFTYLPRQDGSPQGTVAQYRLYVSRDGVAWGDPIASGAFANNGRKQQVFFAARAGQFVRFVAQSEVNSQPWTSAAEISVLGTPVTVPHLVEIPQSQMRIMSANPQASVEKDRDAEKAIDNDPDTFWHTERSPTATKHPHHLDLALGGTYEVWGLRYLPRQDGELEGTVLDYAIYVSMDGTDWGPAAAMGTMSKDTAEKALVFVGRVGRFVRFVARSEVNGQPWTSAAEIHLLAAPHGQP